MAGEKNGWEPSVDWLVENYDLSTSNAQAIVEQFRAQLSVSEIPVDQKNVD